MTPAQRTAFEAFAQKAHVRRDSCQRTAYRLLRQFAAALTIEEARALGVAWGHALDGEGRAEFFATCDRIRNRIGRG